MSGARRRQLAQRLEARKNVGKDRAAPPSEKNLTDAERLIIEETGKPPAGWYKGGKPRWKNVDKVLLDAKKAHHTRKVQRYKQWVTDRVNSVRTAIDRSWRRAKARGAYAKWRFTNSRAIQGLSVAGVLAVLYFTFSGSKPSATGAALEAANSALEGVAKQAPMGPEIVAKANAVKKAIEVMAPQLGEEGKALSTYTAMLDQIIAAVQPVASGKLNLNNVQSATGYLGAIKAADQTIDKFFDPLQKLQAFFSSKGNAQAAAQCGELIGSLAEFANTVNAARGVML
jgi:hypothetical protein